MEKFEPYDPEDLERLICTKDFNQLLPEEQAFALKHVGSAEEYDSIRALHATLSGKPGELAPGPSMKANVMRAFRDANPNRDGGPVWWKGWFGISPWYSPRNRGLALVIGVIFLLMLATPLIWHETGPELLAENKTKKALPPPVQEPENLDTDEQSVINKVDKEEEVLNVEIPANATDAGEPSIKEAAIGPATTETLAGAVEMDEVATSTGDAPTENVFSTDAYVAAQANTGKSHSEISAVRATAPMSQQDDAQNEQAKNEKFELTPSHALGMRNKMSLKGCAETR